MANPIIPWIGGKRRLANIIPRFPAHDCYVEVFAGALRVLPAAAGQG
jgi:DNA adenine methylase